MIETHREQRGPTSLRRGAANPCKCSACAVLRKSDCLNAAQCRRPPAEFPRIARPAPATSEGWFWPAVEWVFTRLCLPWYLIGRARGTLPTPSITLGLKRSERT